MDVGPLKAYKIHSVKLLFLAYFIIATKTPAVFTRVRHTENITQKNQMKSSISTLSTEWWICNLPFKQLKKTDDITLKFKSNYLFMRNNRNLYFNFYDAEYYDRWIFRENFSRTDILCNFLHVGFFKKKSTFLEKSWILFWS